MRYSSVLRVGISLISLAAIVNAQAAQDSVETERATVTAAREWIGGRPFSEWTRVSGDWGGYRTRLEEIGIEVAGSYTADWVSPLHGGQRSRDTYVSLTDVNVAFDLDTLLGLERSLLYVDAYQIHGRQPSNDIGDAQGVSNIQGPNTEQVAELWFETWVGERLRFKVGKVDFNSEFAFNEFGGDFVHSTVAITPSIVAYPTYPNPAAAFIAFCRLEESSYVSIGAFDGAGADGFKTGRKGLGGPFESTQSDSWFFACEVGTAWAGGNTWGSGRLALGAWHHSAQFAQFSGGTSDGSSGAWFTFEQVLHRENPEQQGDDQGLRGFVTLGFADDDVTLFGRTTTVGCSWVGPLERRDSDVLGLAMNNADLSDRSGAGTRRPSVSNRTFNTSSIRVVAPASTMPSCFCCAWRSPSDRGDAAARGAAVPCCKLKRERGPQPCCISPFRP
ncbi:MAG TPA: carbohydrate porin [Planctomycetota bacterium]|nr:carbohydrate porin [Planctomycetota bacterium]